LICKHTHTHTYTYIFLVSYLLFTYTVDKKQAHMSSSHEYKIRGIGHVYINKKKNG